MQEQGTSPGPRRLRRLKSLHLPRSSGTKLLGRKESLQFSKNASFVSRIQTALNGQVARLNFVSLVSRETSMLRIKLVQPSRSRLWVSPIKRFPKLIPLLKECPPLNIQVEMAPQDAPQKIIVNRNLRHWSASSLSSGGRFWKADSPTCYALSSSASDQT
jgi:hypothetical protein